MLRVLGRATSSNVQRVMWTLAELGLDCPRVDVGGTFGGNDTPDYLAKNPHGLVPTVEFDDGRVMWESAAIVRWLALHQDPERRLWPAGGQDELSADMWAEWAARNVEAHVTQLFISLVRVRSADRDWSRIHQHGMAIHKGLAAAEPILAERAFLATDHLTIADINFGLLLYRYYEMEIERPDLPNVAAYYQRLTERPTYAEHVMIDFSFARPPE
ncbi:glutathione S-transferase family protein [Acuticoccus sp. I52.16.1]|uniref:glutathione S-transferase family protein n=1 Tax=Acuticoccus sp. I52.16.1 TaxID=2928472 RepID=UPI001FD03B6B|nr:glutathione S-transferase family protein [Acuticoccus sp. I52.16.1]UOM32870.1 glutathione S-transferase family protein [Acuticoccus sp. I52.16.1]